MVSSLCRIFSLVGIVLLMILQRSEGVEQAPAPIPVPITTKTLHGRTGTMTIKIVGDLAKKGTTPVIALPGAAADLRDEWLPLTTLLARTMDYVCVLVYLDSIVKPWVAKDIMDMLATQVLHNTLRSGKAVILGKSYGGLLAQEFALQYPQQIVSLVLFAPASTNHKENAAIDRLCKHRPALPIFLGWTGDDSSYMHRSKFLRACTHAEFLFHSELYGGHAITPEYYEPITKFLALYKKH